jgi:6-phosphogluconolactonase
MTDTIDTKTYETLTFPGAAGNVSVLAFASPALAGAYVSGQIVEALSAAMAARGKAVWIGCGGTTPKPIYENLVHAPLDWSKISLGQVDERFVPVDTAASNTRMMREALLPVLSDGDKSGMDLISLIEDITDQQSCAEKAEARLLELGGGHSPLFDFALLGMGPDAHYASIFPENPINSDIYTTRALVRAVSPSTTGAEPVLPRITLSVPAINNSRRIVFFITGQTKLDVLKTACLTTDPFISPIGAFLAQCPAPVDFVWAA